jgi:hypothetical protein
MHPLMCALGPLLRYLPTTAYLYGLLPGQCFRMRVPRALAASHLFVKTESSGMIALDFISPHVEAVN